LDLKEFISDTLTQIAEGIRDAQARSGEHGAWISPVGPRMPTRDGAKTISATAGYAYLDEIKFDVAITATEATAAGGHGGVKIFAASIGASGSLSSQNSAVSRIQFSVPIVLPGSTNEERDKLIQADRAQIEAARKGVPWQAR